MIPRVREGGRQCCILRFGRDFFPLLLRTLSERERKTGYVLVFQGRQSTLAKVQRGPKTNLPTIVRSIGYVFVLFATH